MCKIIRNEKQNLKIGTLVVKTKKINLMFAAKAE